MEIRVEELDVYTERELNEAVDYLLEMVREEHGNLAEPRTKVTFYEGHTYPGGAADGIFEVSSEEWQPERRTETLRAQAQRMAAKPAEEFERVVLVCVAWWSGEAICCSDPGVIHVVGVDVTGEFAARSVVRRSPGVYAFPGAPTYEVYSLYGGPPPTREPNHRSARRLIDEDPSLVSVIQALHGFLDTCRATSDEIIAGLASAV